MVYTTFSKNYSDISNEPMFLGKNVNTFRTDIKKYSLLNENTDKAYEYFNDDIKEFNALPEVEQNFFIKVLQFLISINSTQSRGISVALLQLASLPEIENFIQKCSFTKLDQLLKYNSMVKCLSKEPTAVLDDITKNRSISRVSRDFGIYYDLLILDIGFFNTRGEGLYFVSGKERRVNKLSIKKEIFLAIIGCYAAECIKNKKNHMCLDLYKQKSVMKNVISLNKEIDEDNNVIIENLKKIINLWKDNKDDPEMNEVYFRFSSDAKKVFVDVFNEEILSLEYLFRNNNIYKDELSDHIYNLTKKSMNDVGLETDF